MTIFNNDLLDTIGLAISKVKTDPSSTRKTPYYILLSDGATVIHLKRQAVEVKCLCSDHAFFVEVEKNPISWQHYDAFEDATTGLFFE